jgi:curved DNA-binding protein CbpA
MKLLCAQVLGVAWGHTREELRQAYRSKSKKTHPDKGKTGQDDAKDEFRRVAIAYEVLGDAEHKDAYDNGRDLVIEQREDLPSQLRERILQHYFQERFEFLPFGDPEADGGADGPQAAA